MRIDTKCVHSGTIADEITGGLNTPIYPSSAFEYLDVEEAVYPRYFNTPNQKAVVEKICELEGGEAGFVFSSGMAAISSVFLAFLKAGDHAVLQDEIYGGSHAFVQKFFERFGISCSFVATSPEAIEEAIRQETKVIFIETPTNPLVNIIDIRAVADVAKRNKCISVIDNTFATPIYQNPIEHGIDVVVHSGTKYLGGHSDLSCGAAVTSSELALEIRNTALNFGGNINALTCYLLERSLKTMAIRVRQQTDNAFALAKFLADQPFISKVNYPGLPDHPGHAIAKEQMSGFGAMLSFELGPGMSAHGFMKKLKLVKPAVSLGGVETTICDPVSTSHAKVAAEVRARQGITDNLLRLSVGIEYVEDLMEDLGKAAKN
jgi:cystathionine beta-lyase